MTEGLYDRPILVVDPGMHTAMINRAAVDAGGQRAVTASDDCTVRVWSLVDGTLERTIRLPSGPDGIGKAYAAAITPDGSLIAVGGWTRASEKDWQEQIYIFDRATGLLARRIDGLHNNVLHLAFSPDGAHLAATFAVKGLRIYAQDCNWSEVARDEAYQGPSYYAAFDGGGRLVTTALDGQIRLYGSHVEQRLRPCAVVTAPDGAHPIGIGFDPDGKRIAVGYHDTAAVTLLDGGTLSTLQRLGVRGIKQSEGGDLQVVVWSRDGRTLYAGGNYRSSASRLLVSWSGTTLRTRRTLPSGLGAITSIVALPDGDLLVATAAPSLDRIGSDGSQRWTRPAPTSEFSDLFDRLGVSHDGLTVDFCYGPVGRNRARFDLKSRAVTFDPPDDGRTSLPLQDSLPVEGWFGTFQPTLRGRPLPMFPTERARCLVIHPALKRFAVGTTFMIRAFDLSGTLLWSKRMPGAVLGVNVSGDGRLLVSACGDGVIRWHRITDGAEILAFMPFADRSNWVAWTPEGFYGATAGAHGVLRWHINRGWDLPADSVRCEAIPGAYRPEMLPLVIQELETPRALGLAELSAYNERVMLRTNSRVPPGARLHLLTIGINAYNEARAKHLRLRYADRDANDLASAILSTQAALYDVKPQVLANEDANKSGILRALKTMRESMAAGRGSDLSVIHFSGHGAFVEGKLYLLPSDVDARDSVGIKATALSLDELRVETLAIAKNGRVLVLLDACHSGATTMHGETMEMDSTALRLGLAGENVTVLTSSSGKEKSFEGPEWEHGAFTKVLLESFDDPAADLHKNRLISAIGLANFIKMRVPLLTDGHQNPGMEIRFEGTLFASSV